MDIPTPSTEPSPSPTLSGVASSLGHASSVYGPVDSWRVGKSLGIDLLLQTSICSFNCIYCQLGDIQEKTLERKIYVPTEQLEKDFKHSAWQEADIVTLSGSGEPTLALNIGEVIHFIREYSQKPVMVLTNGTLLQDAAVRRDLREADQIAVKLDASSEEGLQRMNRPVSGVTLAGVIEGAVQLKQSFPGKLSLQCMFMPTNLSEVDDLSEIINRIQPDNIQLNTPKRPYPLEWRVESRGNHGQLDYPNRVLRVLDPLQAEEIEKRLQERISVPIISIYKKS